MVDSDKNKISGKVVLVIAIFWLIIIIGFIGFKEYTIQTGDEYLVKTQPVDPRDLFRGDYVILSYDVSRIDLNDVKTDSSNYEIGEDVFVIIEKDVQGYLTAEEISRYPPSNENLKFIKAKVTRNSSNSLRLEYGIESYFVPEGEGREIERYRGDGMDVKIAVDKKGNAIIKELLIDGKVVNFN